MATKDVEFIINENGCHICISHSKSKDGYIRCKANKENTTMHRHIYQLRYGRLPKDIVVRHKCDNPACINIEHLETGTHADNVRDRVERNRSARLTGENNPNHKLTDAQVNEILESKGTLMDIANKYGVSFSLVGLIRRKEIRTHTQEV